MKKITIGNATLYNCDYREVISEIKADSILTDPPYQFESKGGGIGAKRDYLADCGIAGITDGFELSVFDNFNHAVSFCNKAQIKDFIVYAESNGYSWRMLTWHKTNPTPLTNNNYLPDTEYIFHIWKNQPLAGGYDTKKTFFVTQVEKNKFNHPTVKPLSVITPLVLNMSKPGQTIFDPFAGTFTAALACLSNDRHFIGCEINKDYFEIGCERIAMQLSQGDIFSVRSAAQSQKSIFDVAA